MNFRNIQLESRDSGIFCLTINRPKVLNALNNEVLEEMGLALDLLAESNEARVLLITGAGDKAFVAGADIEHMSRLSPMEGKAFAEYGMAIFRRLENLNIPVIALVNGFALGGGCELAMSCDFILAADNAKFGQPEVNLGITPGFGGSQRLTRLVGRPMALELLFSGRMMAAEEALQQGLVNHIYPQQALMEEGLKLAANIASKSGTAQQLSKQLVQRGQDLDLDNACIMESDLFGLSFSTDDRKEGMSAFLEKRAPSFV
ncbi:enoyl-CoA hydratase-related protein [Amphritea sp. 1_MG-2023]|uniref:enoyl-CoA hydratase-related protein n=1 Tax=Amphritea sp. 1_MG-2023 TaxID=3062670 RepID=UPI0026E2EB7F|nr:enoyl-CoA hydratase-related protein [Amphritea sp. 1_MG-2023]MDO6565071.1 enoyl-CoA hydratase-related protein [Amphritea sp. 1_MG-2023]